MGRINQLTVQNICVGVLLLPTIAIRNKVYANKEEKG